MSEVPSSASSDAFAAALNELEIGHFTGTNAFLRACDTLRLILLRAAADPDPKYRRLRKTNERVSQEILSVPGIDDALARIGFQDDGDTLTLAADDPQQLDIATAALDTAAGGVRRRGLVQMTKTCDARGWSAEIHDPKVLARDAKFKGAVFDAKPRPGAPSGLITFHNSPFSNFWNCRVALSHRGMRWQLATSEALLMAVKQHLLAPKPGVAPHESLASALHLQSCTTSGAEAKEAAARATRRAADYTWWAHHGMHVLVGATACLLKFSQDAGLKRLLLSTQGVLMVEAAPNDGAWGIAMHSADALVHVCAQDFDLHSTAEDRVQFDVHGTVYARPRREANALGKALMIARSLLLARHEAPPPIELGEAVGLVAEHMRLLQLPFDWAAAHSHLQEAL